MQRKSIQIQGEAEKGDVKPLHLSLEESMKNVLKGIKHSEGTVKFFFKKILILTYYLFSCTRS